MNTSWIEIKREEYVVYVYIQKQYIKTIKKLSHPFFTIKNVIAPIPNNWCIYLSICNYPLSGSRIIKPTMPEEILTNKVYIFNEKKKSIFVSEPFDADQRIQITIRLARDIIKHLYYEKNMIYLHAGMVFYKNHGICIIGEKKAGKTSTMLAFLSSGADLISNDDLSVLCGDDGRCVGYGWPRAISIRKDTLVEMHEIMNNYCIDKSLTHPDNLDKSLIENKIYVYPYELCNVFSCDIKKTYPIDYIIVPEFSDDSFSFEEIEGSEKTTSLISNLDTNIDKYFQDFAYFFPQNNVNSNLIFKLSQTRIFKVRQRLNGMHSIVSWMDGVIGE